MIKECLILTLISLFIFYCDKLIPAIQFEVDRAYNTNRKEKLFLVICTISAPQLSNWYHSTSRYTPSSQNLKYPLFHNSIRQPRFSWPTSWTWTTIVLSGPSRGCATQTNARFVSVQTTKSHYFGANRNWLLKTRCSTTCSKVSLETVPPRI